MRLFKCTVQVIETYEVILEAESEDDLVYLLEDEEEVYAILEESASTRELDLNDVEEVQTGEATA